MNLNQLLFANAVASAGSFTAAAAKCCVTPPALSNGMALLENELGGQAGQLHRGWSDAQL